MAKSNKKKPEIFTKEYWSKQWKNALINLAIYFSVLIAGILLDLLTKHFIYKEGYTGSSPDHIVYESSFIRLWSVFHAGTTLEIGLTMTGLHIVSILIILATMVITLFFRDKRYRWTVASIALVASGAFGNMYDRFAYGGVRDIINLPWANKGTFNIADTWLVFGAVTAFLSIAIISLINWYQSKKNKTEDTTSKNEKVDEDIEFNSDNKIVVVDSIERGTGPLEDPNHNFND
ncbi:signal peptidase II [Metamycoplasma spumans]|uniref:signal peptidase II n=1 Tax=Metamycoplasma spumans TaxID=92406 RepID=UPI0034DD0BF1